jgi:hypothetical protein
MAYPFLFWYGKTWDHAFALILLSGQERGRTQEQEHDWTDECDASAADNNTRDGALSFVMSQSFRNFVSPKKKRGRA